jgi:hypothetical protein
VVETDVDSDTEMQEVERSRSGRPSAHTVPIHTNGCLVICNGPHYNHPHGIGFDRNRVRGRPTGPAPLDFLHLGITIDTPVSNTGTRTGNWITPSNGAINATPIGRRPSPWSRPMWTRSPRPNNDPTPLDDTDGHQTYTVGPTPIRLAHGACSGQTMPGPRRTLRAG